MRHFTPLLTVLFIGLKLTGVIAWSWVWVLSPLWIPLVILALMFAVIFAVKPLREAFLRGARTRLQKAREDKLVDLLVNKSYGP
jgi:uncharacterized protein (DUF983 family)